MVTAAVAAESVSFIALPTGSGHLLVLVEMGSLFLCSHGRALCCCVLSLL